MLNYPIFELILAGLSLSLFGVVSGNLFPSWLALIHWPLALALTAAWACWRLMQFGFARHAYWSWRCTPAWHLRVDALARQQSIDRGACIGRGFPWTAAHVQVLETALASQDTLPIAEDSRGGHPALHAVGLHEETAVVLPWEEMFAQVAIAGATGSGKTRLLEAIATELMRKPGAVVVIDPKGDRDLYARCAAEAHRRHRPFALIIPAFPAQSATMNILASAGTPAEVAARIHALMPSAGGRTNDPFFEQYPLALIERIATAQQTLGQPWTLEGLYAPAVIQKHSVRLLKAYLAHLGCTGNTAKDLIASYQALKLDDHIADALIDDHQKPREHFVKITANLIPAFSGMVGPPFGHLFSALTPDCTWPKIVNDEMVVYIALGSMMFQETANRIGRAILHDLIGFLGRRYMYEDTATATPISLIIDEFGNVVYPLFVDALNKGRGAQARFILAQQSYADTEATIGQIQAQRILDNLNTQIWFRLASDKTAMAVSEGSDTCLVTTPQSDVGIGYGGTGGLTGRASKALRPREVPLVKAGWLKALPRGECYMRLQGHLWKVRVPLLDPVPETALQTLGPHGLWPAAHP